MAEAFGIASGLVGLAGFAFQTSKSLYQLVESFKSSKRAIRDLRDELQSLNDVLKTLKGTAAELEDELDALKQPLLRCGRICQEFEEILKSCTSHSGVDRTSFRDWAKLRYMGGDINNLRTTLAGYKATISIALGSATLYVCLCSCAESSDLTMKFYWLVVTPQSLAMFLMNLSG